MKALFTSFSFDYKNIFIILFKQTHKKLIDRIGFDVILNHVFLRRRTQ